MRRDLFLLLGVLFAATPFLRARAWQNAVLTDRLLIKVDHMLPCFENDELQSTGDHALDQELAGEGVVEFRRVFRHPPRGWNNPAAAERVGLGRWLLVRFAEERIDLERVSARIRSLEGVELCELEHLGTVAGTLPDDPDFYRQYSLQNGILNAPQAWDVQTDSNHVVAVVDTGADLDHQDLQDNLWQNPGEIPNNGVDDDMNGYVDDVVGWDFAYDDNTPEDGYGHGIHVSGIVGAKTDNARQVAGVCWNVPIMEVQILDNNGQGGPSRAAAGIVYAADNGASVLNNSYGYFVDAQVLEDAVIYAAALDVVVVAAAHNQGSDTEIYPAAYDEVMGIIATDRSDNRPGWSNYGSWCDMAAPGVDVLNLWLGNGTTNGSGTSMSSPHVAGAAALVRAVNPSLDAVDTRWILNYSAVDLGALGFDNFFGWGRLDLAAAVKRAQSLSISTNTAQPGDSVTLDLSEPDEPGFLHILLASRSGRVPGISLSVFDASDTRQVPLNEDGFLFLFILGHPGGAGVFVSFVDFFDGNGNNTAMFNIPPGPFFSGEEVDFAYVTLDPADLSRVSSISASNHLEIQ